MTRRVDWQKRTPQMGFRMNSPREGEEQKACAALSGPSYGSSPQPVENRLQHTKRS